MSLMNDMLRDLEKRQAPDRTQQVEAQGYGALTQKTDSHSSRAVILLLGVIIAMLLALAVGWWYLKTTPQGSHTKGVMDKVTINTAAVTNEKSNNQVDLSITPAGEVTPDKPNNISQQSRIESSAKEVEVADSSAMGAQSTPSVLGTKDISVTEASSIATKPVVTPAKSTPVKSSAVDVQSVASQNVKVKEVKAKEVKAKDEVASVAVSPAKQAKVPAKKVNAEKSGTQTEVLSKVLVVSPEQRDENSAERADELIKAGNREKAKTQLRAFIDAYDVDMSSRASLVTLLMQDGNMAGANALLTDDKLARSSHLRRLKAHWLAQSGQPDEAIALLNSARPDIELDPEYHVLLAALYQQQGFSSEAVAAYAELLSYNSQVADWWVGMAIALDSSQQYPSAKKAYQKALQMEGLKFELADFAKQRLATLGG